MTTSLIKRLTRSFLIALILTMSVAAPAWAQSFDEIDEMMSAWRMTEAKTALDAYAKKNPTDPRTLFLKGRYEFFMGEYEEAANLLDQALTNAGGQNARWKMTRDIIASTHEVTKSYEAHTSPNGKFVVYIEPGRDKVLLPYAFEALDKAYEELGAELGHYPETPIRVEVYPSTVTLAKVSSLTEHDIRTSGTIALCKYNRLMITSPKALMRGYGWVDTLVHEYVHYVVNHKTKNRVPIWMHEGLAKYLERRWRGEDAQRLPPSSEHLLRQRLEANTLITFEQMHPSMAKLPSQEDAAVAFAEVYTVMEYLRVQHGQGAFARVLDHINAGDDAPQAFAKVLNTSFRQFERDWRAYLSTRPEVEFVDVGFEEKLRFDDEGDANVTDLKAIPKPEARDHMHLGELLQTRERYGAAVVQYKKAIALMGENHPVVQTRLARSLLELDRPAEALAALDAVRGSYPSYVLTWLESGTAALELKDYKSAYVYLLEAARINPFDPSVHQKLAKALEGMGDKAGAERERKLAALVM